MAIKSLIFDYQTAEDEYTASDFREVYKHFVSNGVLLEKEDSLLDNTKCKVVAIEGGVRISNGTAQINGSQAIITDEDILIETDGTYKIILEWNVVLNKIYARAITDATLTRTDTVYQIQLSQVVKSGTTYTITDKRNDESVCGYANRMLDNQADNLKAQIESGWNLITGTFTYSNTTTITTSADCTSFLSAGMKLKCTNGTVKMSAIKSVTATTIALESAVLASGTITDVYFSIAQVPFGYFKGDFIVESGTDGVWTWGKYASGMCDCWAKKAITANINTAAVGGGFFGNADIALPANLFAAVPEYIAPPFLQDEKVFRQRYWSSSKDTITYSLISQSSYTSTGIAFLYVKGRWK